MKLTMQDKLNICKEHIIEGKTLSHISERYDDFPTSSIKYMIGLYKKHGEEPFNSREIIGYAAGKHKNAELVYKAFSSIKYDLNKINIFHTDRGNEFKIKPLLIKWFFYLKIVKKLTIIKEKIIYLFNILLCNSRYLTNIRLN